MKNQGLTAWLIIFLALIIFGLAWLMGYNMHLQTVNKLNSRIQELSDKLTEQESLFQEEESFSLPQATPSSLLEEDSSSSAEMELLETTGSGLFLE